MASFPYRLLVVDDDPSIRDLMQTSLSMQGYEVRVAKDGFDALAQMRGALPDLIITDLKMANMSGFEFLSVVRRRFPQIPTIAISGEYEPPVAELGVLADAFLPKPHMPEELFAKIAELLQVAPVRPALPKDRSPVWVPRNGKYYVITCTDCLRSFSIPAEENDRFVRDLRTLECIFCNALVKFIVEEKFRVIPGRAGTPNTESSRS
jgi:DNA-binding response OmpR family regulator